MGISFSFLLRYESYHGGSELITDEFEERGMKKNRNGAGFSENNIVRERGGGGRKFFTEQCRIRIERV